MKKNLSGFTLIEILFGILIFSIVIIGGFQALSAVTLGKIKLIEKTNISKDIVYFTEKVFEEIKSGGTIDYEEYFNRKVVGTTTSTGHYTKSTGYGNFGTGGSIGTTTYGDAFYYCRSGSGTNMGTGGCYNNVFNNLGGSLDGSVQRYGQYAFQFIDYNSNEDNDNNVFGDENLDGNIRGDDDDENLGEGPLAFTGGINVREVYLISGDGKKRTLLRWNWKLDPDPKRPVTALCNGTTFGSGCLGTIEILKLDGRDWGMDHAQTTNGTGLYDGIIDTWLIDNKFLTGTTDVVAGTNDYNYRQSLFPDSISVSDFEAYLYPNVNVKYAWKDTSPASNINPYLRLKITLEPSWKKRTAMKGLIPKYTINTTINLVDYFTN